MHYLVILFFACLLQLSNSLNELLLYKDPQASSMSQKIKSESLAKLLRKIADEYFDDCTLGVIYDSAYEQDQPIDFELYFVGITHALTQETIDFSEVGKPHERRTDKCINYIIFLNSMFAMKQVIDKETKSKIVVVSAETPWDVKDFLKSHLSKNYMHLLVITHSTSRKTGDGSYLLYTHKLYADGSGSSRPLLLASWINDSITVKEIDLFPEKLKKGFMGHRLLVSTFNNPPFTIRRSSTRWDGLEIRLLKLSASYLNLTVEFTETRSSADSSIDSIKNDVSLGLMSAGIGGIYQTANLIEFFDTTTPYAEDCAVFVSLASTALPKYRAILGPFQLSVWLLICAAYFVLIVPLSFNSKYTLLSLIKNPGNSNRMFWYVFSTYTNSFVVKSPLLDYGIAKNSTTVLLGIYWVFTIIVTACYTGSIVAFITLPVYPSALETAKELLSYRYRIGTLDHNGWEKWFNINTTDDPFLKKLYRKMDYVPSILEGVQNASRAYFWPYAFLGSKTSLDYVIQTDFAPSWSTKRALMHISDECFVRYNVVQIFPKKSLYTKSMNYFINLATETGWREKIIADFDWEVQRLAVQENKQVTKKISRKILVEDRILTVEDTQGMFLILGAGVLMALLALSLEIIANLIRRRKYGKNDEMETDESWRRVSLIDSWVIREIAIPEINQIPTRRSV